MAATGVAVFPHGGVTFARVAIVRVVIIALLLVGWEALARSGLLFRDVVPALGAIARAVIALPRPRTSEIVSSTAFGHHVAEIWNDLREEASRGMRDEETHARATGPK